MQQSILRTGYEVAYSSGFIMSGEALRHIFKCYEGSFSQPNKSLAATILKMVWWISTKVIWRQQCRYLLSEIRGECIRCHCAPRPGVHIPTHVNRVQQIQTNLDSPAHCAGASLTMQSCRTHWLLNSARVHFSKVLCYSCLSDPWCYNTLPANTALGLLIFLPCLLFPK